MDRQRYGGALQGERTGVAHFGKEGIMRRLRTALFLAVMAVLVFASLQPAASADPGGFIICSCQLCAHSDVICRISPTGFSIVCSDYYATHCV